MPRFAPTRIVSPKLFKLLCIKPKSAAGILLLALCGLLANCGSSSSKPSSSAIPPPSIAGSWEFLAVSGSGAITGIEVQLTEGQQLVNGVEVPNGQIAADSAQMTFVSLVTGKNQTTNISGLGGICDANPTTTNDLSGTVSVLGGPINFTFTANGNLFNVTATLADAKTVLNGTYTPQAGNTCADPGGTITGLAVSIPTGQYLGQMCSPAETSCSSPDDSVTATVTTKSGQVTLALALSGADNTNLTATGPLLGNWFNVHGTFQGQSVTYYGYFEAVYSASAGTNVESFYLVNAADPCFANPGTTCSTATILQIP